MIAKLSRLPRANCAPQDGFAVVEAIVALVVLMVAAAGVGSVLVASNQETTQTGYTLQNQQSGMQAVNAAGGTSSAGVGTQSHTVAVTISAPAATSTCTTGATTGSSVIVHVQTASVGQSFAALSSAQQPPEWWQP